MAILGLDEVYHRIKRENLIENLSRRELNQPEGVGIDLRLGAVYKIISGGAFIEADHEKILGKRKGVKTQLIAEYKKGKIKEVTIEPGEYYLVKTIEIVNTPVDLMPIVYGRTSLSKCGLFLFATKTDPGFRGFFTFGLYNFSKFPVRFQLGARICNIIFHTIEGETVKYRGQHQGGRISIEEEERQV